MMHERWEEDENGIMKPIINFIHVIPLEESLIHCGQRTCWCFPKPDPDNDCVYIHQAVSPTEDGWIWVGELNID
jgi:hypothetical protein